jgi:hypothetical protein
VELRLRIEIPGAPVHDVFCDIDAERRVSDLAQALADKAGLPAPPGHLGLFCRRRVDWLKPSATIRQSAVRSGDELVLAPQGAALAGRWRACAFLSRLAPTRSGARRSATSSSTTPRCRASTSRSV